MTITKGSALAGPWVDNATPSGIHICAGQGGSTSPPMNPPMGGGSGSGPPGGGGPGGGSGGSRLTSTPGLTGLPPLAPTGGMPLIAPKKSKHIARPDDFNQVEQWPKFKKQVFIYTQEHPVDFATNNSKICFELSFMKEGTLALFSDNVVEGAMQTGVWPSYIDF